MTHPSGEPDPVRPPEPPDAPAPVAEPASAPATPPVWPPTPPVAPTTPAPPPAPLPAVAPAPTPPAATPPPAVPPPPVSTQPPATSAMPAMPAPPPRPPAAPPPPPGGRARPPVWPYFLTPVAVLLGAAAIVLAIVLTDGGGDDDSLPPPAPATPVATPAATPAATPEPMSDPASSRPTATPAPATPEAAAPAEEASALLAAFDRYADSLSLDLGQFRECSLHPVPRKAVADQLRQGIDLGVNGTPTFFVNNKRIVGALPADVFIAIIDAELGGDPPTDAGAYPAEIQQLAAMIPARLVIEDARPDVGGAAIKGDPDAPVVIVEYSDFQCPFCRRWYTEVLPQLEERIGDEIALAFAHFPLSQIHANAEAAHVAAECAGEQGKFWEMHDLLFDRQWEWERLRN